MLLFTSRFRRIHYEYQYLNTSNVIIQPASMKLRCIETKFKYIQCYYSTHESALPLVAKPDLNTSNVIIQLDSVMTDNVAEMLFKYIQCYYSTHLLRK